jgi:hypothetical protein
LVTNSTGFHGIETVMCNPVICLGAHVTNPL